MARQFIYHMSGLNKAYGNKKIPENIHLSFYPDAKIGILGPNGAGKSTVLRIIAGQTRSTPAKLGSPTVRRSAIWSRSRISIPTRRCSRMSWKALPRRRLSSIATTN